jgi:hypothetical protein
MAHPIDRNQKAKDEFASAQRRKQMKDFAEAARAGHVGVGDRFGNRLEPKQLVVWIAPPHGMIYEIVSVDPVLDPNAPPGLMRVTLTMTAPVTYRAGQNAVDITVVGRQEELGHAELKGRAGAGAGAEAGNEPPAAQEPSPIELTDGQPEHQPAADSAQPCGCDPAEDHLRDVHLAERVAAEEPQS